MKKPLFLFFVLIFQATSIFAEATVAASKQSLNGYLERVMLLPERISLTAKLDTGADLSSLDAQHIRITEDEKQKRVEFDVYENRTLIKHLSYPLLKMIYIKNRSGEMATNSQVTERPMIEMDVCLGNKTAKIKVNLTDRTKFSYPFLLGREAMKKFNVLIDPTKKFRGGQAQDHDSSCI